MSGEAATLQRNPFPGLRPFREDEEYLFFGRESQVDAMVDKLAANRFLAVVGTSGSGKSSLVNCGLRPALHGGLMARAGTAWRMAQFRPGEYACRGGSTSRYCFGETESLLDKYARYSANSNFRSWPVGSLKPNDLGFFDMHGSMFEWCQEAYREDYTTDNSVANLTVTDEEHRVSRGGSFFSVADDLRAAIRRHKAPNYAHELIGFRVARTYP